MAKIKTIKVSDYFEFIKPKYVFFKLIPHSSTRNGGTDKIAQLVNKTYIEMNKRIYKEEKKIFFRTDTKISYYIYLEKTKAEFYFIVPEQYKRLFKDKLSSCWRNIEIKEVEEKEVPQFSKDSTKYSLSYKKLDALSLAVDKKNNDLLSNNLNIIEILETENNDRMGILYNFIPSSPTALESFRDTHREVIERYRKHKPLDKNKKDIWYMIKVAFNFLLNTADGVLDKFQDEMKIPQTHQITIANSVPELSRATTKKENSVICKSQIVVMSESNDKQSQEVNARALCESYSIIDEDNSLDYREVKTDINILDSVFKNVPVNETSTSECSNLLAMPGRELLNRFKEIECLKVLENPAPKELTKGWFRLGKVKNKDLLTDVYKSDHEQLRRLGIAYLGPMGGGKTTLMANNAYDIVKSGHGLFNLDGVKINELSYFISSFTEKEKLVDINCADINSIQAYAFNELDINDSMTVYEKLENAMLHGSMMQLLIDAINDDDSKVTPQMLRYLQSASAVVFSNKKGATLKHIMECLSSPNKRREYIESLPIEIAELLEEDIANLNSLTKKDKTGIECNRDDKIEGIKDRVAKLTGGNFFSRCIYDKTSENNLNFIDLIRENKVVNIRVPEKKFPNKMVRNIIMTFYLAKIWLAKQQLGDEKCNTTYLLFDEFYKYPNCQMLFEDIFVEARKYELIPVLAMHYIDQLNKKCARAMRSGGCSFLLLQGAENEAYQGLKSYFENLGYAEEDFLNLRQYNALCLVKTSKNYEAFVSELPDGSLFEIIHKMIEAGMVNTLEQLMKEEIISEAEELVKIGKISILEKQEPA